MVSDSVNGFGVNNELFLLSQKQNGALKDGVVYVNGRLNVAVDYQHSSGASASAILNPGLDLAFTATKGWFTAYADLSTNMNDSSSTYWAQSVIPGTPPRNSDTNGPGFIRTNDAATNIYNNNASAINLTQGYLMLGDLSKMPVYMLVGKKYVDFGSFANQDQTWQPLTNYFNQDRQTQLAAGFYTHGFHGAVTLFKAPWTIGTEPGYQNNQLSTMAATLSYGTSVNKFGLHGGLSYTTNMNPAQQALYSPGTSTTKRVSGGILFAEVNFNPITVTANYASAMRSVNPAGGQGKPSAWDIGVKFDFNLMNRANWLSANYSRADNRGETGIVLIGGLNTNTANKQWLFGWNMQVSRDISANFQYGHLSTTNANNLNVFAIGANLYF